LHQENIGSDGGLPTDHGFATQHCGVRINDDPIFDVGMPFSAFDQVPLFVLLETPGTERHAVVELHMVADHTRFANHDPRAVVDEEVCPDAGTRVHVNSGARVRPLGHHARNDRNACLVERVCAALDCDGLHEWIGKNDFFVADRGGIAFVGCFDVGLKQFTDRR